MAVTPKGIVTPDPSSPYNLVTDLNTLASTADAAIVTQKGTASQRAAAMAGASAGTLWQDTDGIKMIWRKDGAAWVPAVWRWAGTTTQMNAFSQAPNGFEWFNSTEGNNYLRINGVWESDTNWVNLPLLGGTGFARASKLGDKVTFWWDIARSLPVNNTNLFSIPAPFNLSTTSYGFGALSTNLAAVHIAYSGSPGTFAVANTSGATRDWTRGNMVSYK